MVSTFQLKIAGELKIDCTRKSKRAMCDQLHNRFPGVVWALDRPDLWPALLFFKPISVFALLTVEV